MSFVTTTAVLGSAVADAGTVSIAYPTGTNQAYFTGINAAANTGSIFINDNDEYPEAASGVAIAILYDTSVITITNNTVQTWPAGALIRVQLGRAGMDAPAFERGSAITNLTDSSGGTASDTLAAIGAAYVEATIENTVASLARKINQLLVELRSQGIIR